MWKSWWKKRDCTVPETKKRAANTYPFHICIPLSSVKAITWLEYGRAKNNKILLCSTFHNIKVALPFLIIRTTLDVICFNSKLYSLCIFSF